MGIPRRWRRLAGLAGCAAVVLGLAAGGSPAARAQGQLGPGFNPHAAASWGDNFVGELGNGSTTGRDIPGTVSGLTSGVLQVSAGGDHGLAITSGGTVWAWGNNNVGQLGDGTTTTMRTTPVQLTGLSGVRQVSAGIGHSLALRSDGTVWAWGQNDHGQVGDGMVSSTPQLTPVEVTGLTGVTKIAAGWEYSLALRSDGTVWAWGRNAEGELGDGSTADSPVPVHVGLPPATAVFAGSFAAYATSTTTAGVTLWAWGANGRGELGDGTRVNRSLPERVTGATDIAQVAVGESFVIVLVTNGSITAWGDDEAGQLGNEPTQVPVTHPVETIAGGSGITQVSAGQSHVLAVTSAGGVIAWGRNSEGQLGTGTTARVVGPVHVAGLSGVSQVDAGGFFSLAVYVQQQGTG